MAGKQSPRSRSSPILLLLITLSLLALYILYYLFSLSHGAVPSTLSHQTRKPETSFVVSLEHFLLHRAPKSSPPARGVIATDDVVRDLDESMHRIESERMWVDPYFPAAMPIRVYVYEMPSKFTYDLLWLFRNTYRDTSNLTSNGSPVHRLIEQAGGSRPLLHTILHHHKLLLDGETTMQSALQGEALNWVTNQPAWKRSGGRDHILPVHHPWSFKSVRKFMKNAIWLLPDMDSTGNWYKPGQVFLEKDLILPYVANVDLCDAKCLSESYSKRTTLLFFRGRLKRNAGGKVRAKLVAELSGAEGVVIEEGTAGEGGKAAAQNGMRKSIFCLSPAGDTPSSARLFDAIVSGCIPVIVSDELELPFEGMLDYRKIALFVSSTDAVQPGRFLTFLRGIRPARIREMQRNLAKYSGHFLYSSPAQPLGPEDLVWRMMAGKLVNIKLHIRRSQRVVKDSRSLCSCDCRQANFTSSGLLS